MFVAIMPETRSKHCQENMKSFVLYGLLMLSLVLSIGEAKHQLCVRPPDWKFYDIVDHFAAGVNLTSFQNSTQPSSSSILLESNASFFRSPFAKIDGNITLVVLTNMNELKQRNEHQQITNLELVYSSLKSANFSDVRFVLINSKDSFDPAWVQSIRSQVSFEVFQELESNPIWSELDGGNGDMFIYDRCGLLTYYIPFPLSFIHTSQPIVQAALLATYFDSPCKDMCNISSSNNSETDASNSGTITSANITLVNQSNSNQLNETGRTNATSNTILLQITNQTTATGDIEQHSYDNMGQILMKFFHLFRLSSNPGQRNRTANVGQNLNKTLANLNASLTETKNDNKNADLGRIELDRIENAPKTPTLNVSRASLQSKLRGQTKEMRCDQTKCREWSFERLLKARLCCLNKQSFSDDSGDSTRMDSGRDGQAGQARTVRNTGPETSLSCQQYVSDRCDLVLPIIKCCLQKGLNTYFDLVIRRRALQQRQQLGTAGASNLAGPRHLAMLEPYGRSNKALISPRMELVARVVESDREQLNSMSLTSVLLDNLASKQSHHQREGMERSS